MTEQITHLQPILDDTFTTLEQALTTRHLKLRQREIGRVTAVGAGVAYVAGLPGIQSEELVFFPGRLRGMALNLDRDEVGIIVMGASDSLAAGAEVQRTGRVLDIPVGNALLGRVIDPLGRPLDSQEPLVPLQRLPIERGAPPIMHRAPVTTPLQTGIKVIDALIPIGCGQRQLILGDRQTGKSAVALDTIINQRETGMICVYCTIGQRSAAVARLIADLRQQEAMPYTTVVVASGEDAPGLQYIAPYAATSIAEYFMEQGRDVLIVYDDLTHHARAYRELSLLLRRPPGREAYPGDIFYIHSRLLERATQLRPEHGGGSLTALPIIETQAQDMSGYIPTNLISITDGQIYLSPLLFQKGMLPAVDVGKSVSRVGGQAQLAAYRAIAGPLRLAYTQFEELEIFSRFSTRLDKETLRTLQRGRCVREVLKQPRFSAMSPVEQIAILFAAIEGIFDDLPLDQIAKIESALQQAIRQKQADLGTKVEGGTTLTDEEYQELSNTIRYVIGAVMDREQQHADD